MDAAQVLSLVYESRRDRYVPMLGVLTKAGVPEVTQSAEEELDWAIRVLKRDDRIQWYLKLARISLCNLWLNKASLPEEKRAYFQSAMDTLAKKTDPAFMMSSTAVSLPLVKNSLAHFFSMNIHKIETFVFKDQPWSARINEPSVLHTLRKFETEWQDQTKAIDGEDEAEEYGDQIEDLITFPNGWKWVWKKVASCDIEGAAMKHCGNTATPRKDDTILSLRSPIKQGERTFWRIHATFIFNTRTGLLGEMKGFANSKPGEELHPYIEKLLEWEKIEGIWGGGHQPEKNFSLSDLSPEAQERIKEKKPNFQSGVLMGVYLEDLPWIESLEYYVVEPGDDDQRDWSLNNGSVSESWLEALRNMSREEFSKQDSMNLLVKVPNTSWGDYIGSGSDRANFNGFRDEFGKELGVWELRGSYSSKGFYVAVKTLANNISIQETVQELLNTGTFDGADSNLEYTVFKEDWESYYYQDFQRQIIDIIGRERQDHHTDADFYKYQEVAYANSSELFVFCLALMSEKEIYPELESATSITLDTEGLLEDETADSLLVKFKNAMKNKNTSEAVFYKIEKQFFSEKWIS